MTDLNSAFQHIEQYAELLMKRINIPGMAIAVTDRENLLKIFNFGFSDIAAKTPVAPDSLFETASMGKSFTSIMLLQLRDEGKLDLNIPVTRYLPWFQVQSGYPPITVHHLMGHTAGIIRGNNLAPHGLYDSWALRETKTNTAPGKYWHYSSVGYKTLGFLLERLTGQSLKELIQSRILDPLGMTNTHAVITFEEHKKTAIGYCSIYDDRPESPDHMLVRALWNECGTGDGCQASTAGDMAIFVRMLINRGQGPAGRLISEESFSFMAPLAIRTDCEQYGYALVAYPVNGRTYLGHGGNNAGYTSHMLADVEAGLGAVALTNRQTESEIAYELTAYALEVLRAAYSDQQVPPLPSAIDPFHIPNAKDYTGVYRAGDAMLEVTEKDGKLLLIYRGAAVPLEQRDQDRFYIRHPDLNLFLLEFKRDGGKVVETFYGPEWYTCDHYAGPRHFDYPDEWKAYTGHYRTRNPELSNFRVAIRKGVLTLLLPWGDVEPLRLLDDGSFRIGDDLCSPETMSFHTVVEEQALRADYSGCPYYRTFTY